MPPDDDRRSCRVCRNFDRHEGCLGFGRRYYPVLDPPRRCEHYLPDQDDPDQRPGSVRFAWILRPPIEYDVAKVTARGGRGRQ